MFVHMYVFERERERACVTKFLHMIALSVRYLKFQKRCLSDRKKLGVGCSQVDFISNFF
jgi:hypothetical protein